MAKFTVTVKNVKPVLAELKKFEPETFKQLRKEMRTDVKPLVEKIKQRIPLQSPFLTSIRDGFTHSGRTAWNKTDPRSITISTPTSARGRSASTVVMVTQNSAAVSIADKAGMRGMNSGRQPRKRFNINIKGKLGPSQRFGFRTAMQNFEMIKEIQDNIIEKIEKVTNSKIKRIN